jgi:hypothetical protein
MTERSYLRRTKFNINKNSKKKKTDSTDIEESKANSKEDDIFYVISI